MIMSTDRSRYYLIRVPVIGMARKADIPYSTYLKIENGTTPNPSIQNVLNIAEALGISLDELVGRKPRRSS